MLIEIFMKIRQKLFAQLIFEVEERVIPIDHNANFGEKGTSADIFLLVNIAGDPRFFQRLQDAKWLDYICAIYEKNRIESSIAFRYL